MRRNSGQALTALAVPLLMAEEEKNRVLFKQCRLTTQQEGDTFVRVLSPLQGMLA